jgi:hypothetical protein
MACVAGEAFDKEVKRSVEAIKGDPINYQD